MELASKVQNGFGRVLIAVLCFASVCIARADITGNYSSVSSGSLMLIRLTQTKSNLSGFMQWLGADSISRQGYSLRSSQFVGNLDGVNFTLRGGPNCEGKVSGRKLKLQFPTADGRTTTVTLSPTTEAAWNTSVTEFQRKQSIWAKVWDFGGIYTDYVNGFERIAKRAQSDVKKTGEIRLDLQSKISKAESELSVARKSVEQEKSKLTDAIERARVANEKAKELEKVADREESDAARKRAHDARNSAYEADVKVNDAESAVYSAESKVYGFESNLESAQDKFKWNEESASEAKKTLDDLRATYDVLGTPESRKVLMAINKGRITRATVPAKVKLYFYASEDSLSIATLNSDLILTMVPVSSKWGMVPLNGRMYWLDRRSVRNLHVLDVNQK